MFDMNEDLAYQLQMLSVAIVRTQEALQQLNLQAYGLSQRVAAQGYQVPMMQQAPQQVAGFSHAPKVGGLSQTYASVRLATQDNRLSQTASKAADAQQARGLAGQVGNLKPDLGGAAGVHVNSGPTHHTDNGGFSDFTSRFQQGLQEQVKNPGNLAGAHVNSGPTHHTDNGGFSDFTSRFQNPADRLKNPGSLAGAHVNSGPTHHTDNGGFSDFTSRFQNPADQLRNPAGQAGAHVNSGPTHHTDNGGFSDFTSRFQNPADVLSNPAVRIGDTQVKLAENQSLRLGGYLLTKVRG
jgi:hypothetical protein